MEKGLATKPAEVASGTEDWEYESKLRTLMDAKEIEADSNLMAELKKFAVTKGKQYQELFLVADNKPQSFKDIKKLREEKLKAAQEETDEGE